MTQEHQNLPHTAISTWSGFVYQGKIALYHCLKLITDDFAGSRELKLQLESQDDFAVFKAGQCLSLHQVKAYKETLFSAYSKAIETQKEQALSRGIDAAYFHVARAISNVPDSFLLNYHPVKFYSYPDVCEEKDNLYCPLDTIDSNIEKQIKLLINTSGLPPWKAQALLCKSAREILEAIINEKVISVHDQIHKSVLLLQAEIASKEFIDFAVLYEILEADSYDKFEGEEYFLSRLQIDIGVYYQDFCDLLPCTLTQSTQTKLDDYLAAIIALDTQGMMGFLQATMPHRKGRFTKLSEFKDHTFDSDAMRLGLFEIFHKLTQSVKAPGGQPHFTWMHNDKFYYPTGIHTSAEAQDVICHDILKQALSEDVEFLFEGGALITSAIDMPSITHVRFDVDEVAMEENPVRRNSIVSFQQMELVSLKNVPEELQDADAD